MKRFYFVLLALLTVTVSIYLNTLQNGFVSYDDPALVYENRQVVNFSFKEAFTGIVAEDYIPLVTASFAAEYAAFGFDPFYFHLDNVLLHAGNVLLLFIFIYLISSGNLFVAGLTGLLFAIHPLHVESVAWVAERKDVLSTMFYLLALISYWQYLSQRKKRYYVLGLAFFVLALFAKFMAISLPAILILMHIHRRTSWKRTVLVLVPFAMVSLVFTWIHLLLHNRGQHLPEDQAGLINALQRGADSLAFYIHKLHFPIGLSPYYEQGVVFAGWADYLSLALFLILFVILSKKNKSVKNAVFFGGIFFLASIFPVLQIVSFGNKFSFADRFMYLPSMGIFYFISVAWFQYLETAKPLIKNASRLMLALICGVLCFLTVQRNQIWKSSETLWTDQVATYPNSSVAHNNLGSLYLDQRKYDSSITHLRASAKLKPTYADPHINLGLVYMDLNNFAEAQKELAEALKIEPNSAKAHLNLGVIAERSGQYDQAFENYQAAVDLDPDLSIARHNLGVGYYRKKQLDKALEVFNETVRRDPLLPETHHNIGVILAETEKYEAAIQSFRKAIALDAFYAEPHMQLFQIYQKLQQIDLANQEAAAIRQIQNELQKSPELHRRPRRIQ